MDINERCDNEIKSINFNFSQHNCLQRFGNFESALWFTKVFCFLGINILTLTWRLLKYFAQGNCVWLWVGFYFMMLYYVVTQTISLDELLVLKHSTSLQRLLASLLSSISRHSKLLHFYFLVRRGDGVISFPCDEIYRIIKRCLRLRHAGTRATRMFQVCEWIVWIPRVCKHSWCSLVSQGFRLYSKYLTKQRVAKLALIVFLLQSLGNDSGYWLETWLMILNDL